MPPAVILRIQVYDMLHPCITSLPSELVEDVLVSCAANRHPVSIAALAQTCRQFRTLIYDTADSHLWRSLFLTTFDDPRHCDPNLNSDGNLWILFSNFQSLHADYACQQQSVGVMRSPSAYGPGGL